MRMSKAYMKRAGCLLIALSILIPNISFAQNKPVKVIFDTDMCTDCDDVGALAILNKLADLGEAEILACVVDNHDKDHAIAASISAINTYYGRPQIPIGILSGHDGPWGKSSYTAHLRDEFPHHAPPDDQEPSALSVYRTVLASAPDSSVTIISVGYLYNLRELLKSPPDSISPLSGIDLVRAKVSHVVVMGGEFPKSKNAEWNFRADTSHSAQYFAANWPTPVLFSGFEIGKVITTGKSLAATPSSNPVRRAYELHGSANGRPSWDLTAVLAAVRDPHRDWEVSPSGSCKVAADCNNEWVPSPDQGRRYLIAKQTPEKVAEELDSLLDMPPLLNPAPASK